MKKVKNFFAVLFTALLVTGVCTACTKQQENGTAQSEKTGTTETAAKAEKAAGKIHWAESDSAAVAFVGFYTYTEDFRNSATLARLSKKYGFDKNTVAIVENEGDEIYLVIPRFAEAIISVNTFPEEKLIDPDSTVEGKILYQWDGGKTNAAVQPFFVKCKSDGGLVNTEIVIADSGPCSIAYCPRLDQQDGSLIVPAALSESSRSIQDITEPLPESSLAQEVDRPQDNFSAVIQRNGQVLFLVKEAVGSLGDLAYPVQGINGRCVGLFTGDIGQDTNPFLCMAMDDGGVCILNYNSVVGLDPLVPGHCFASARLPNLKNIVSFKQGFVGENGIGYTTIFAVDKSGTEHEIEPCLKPSQPIYFFEKIDDSAFAEHELIIGQDWTIEYISGWYLSERDESYLGRLRPLKIDYDNGVYEYEYEMAEYVKYFADTAPSKKNAKGSFRLTQSGNAYKLSVLSGQILFGTDGTTEVYYGTSSEPEAE